MPNLLKKFVLSFLSFLVVFMSIAPNFATAKAQTWYSQTAPEWYLKVYDQSTSPPNEIFGERYTAAQVQWVVYSFLFLPLRLIEPVFGEDIITCVMKAVGTGTFDINSCSSGTIDALVGTFKGLLGKVFVPISSTNNEPFLAQVFDTSNRGMSGIGYAKSLLKKFSPVSEVMAQTGFGYTGLNWIQSYWTGFRNISYGLLVLVIIVFAFMIMFRVKLSPQTVISVQSALPKVILTMILITFSYAIAGFAIDLMYVVSGLFALLIKSAGFAPLASTTVSAIFNAISGQGWAYNSPLGGLWILLMMLLYTVMFFISAILATVASFASGINLFGAILGVVFMLLGAACLIMMIWYTFKIPYVLIKTLISLYLTIITAPVQILAGAVVPSMGFGAWFKKLMADILVFPVVGVFIWFAWATLWASYDQSWQVFGRSWIGDVGNFFGGNFGAAGISWVPGIVGATGLGNKGGISGIIFLGISFAIMSMVAKVPDMLKGFILGEKFAAGNAIGEAVAGGVGAASSVSTLSKGYGEIKGRYQEIKDARNAKKALPRGKAVPDVLQNTGDWTGKNGGAL